MDELLARFGREGAALAAGAAFGTGATRVDAALRFFRSFFRIFLHGLQVQLSPCGPSGFTSRVKEEAPWEAAFLSLSRLLCRATAQGGQPQFTT